MTDESRETRDEGMSEKKVSRRDFLKYAGVAGGTIAAAGGLGGLLAACGGTTTTTTGATTATTAGGTGSTTATTAAGGATTTVAAGGEGIPGKTKILIEAARPVSGVNAIFEQAHFGPAAHLWVQEVNDAGGLKIAGKQYPIEYNVFDDQSDLDTSMRLLTKIMEEDKADFVFLPCSTAFLFAASRLVNDHKYVAMSAEGGATTLEPKMKDMPYFFQFLNYSDHYQMPVMADLLKELGATTASIIYLDDLHGIEYNAQAQIYFSEQGIKILSSTPVPAGVKDVSSIIKKVQAENPDCVCSFQYPPENALTYGTMAQLAYNPKAVLGGPATSTQAFYDSFKGALDGIMFEGAWTYKQNDAVNAYYKKLAEFVGGPANVDFWGALIYRAELEFFHQAVEKAATLDQAAIADVMRTAHFKTVMADETFMTNQILDRSSYAGQIGQWQAGVPQILDKDKRTTDKIWYPKPTWADAPKGVPSSTTPSS
jgi:branched-chain amino acid transport system substrate-binding protein